MNTTLIVKYIWGNIEQLISQQGIVKRILTNFSWSVINEGVGKFIFFFTNMYLARILGASNYGLFCLAQTITFYFWIAVNLGINMYGMREIAKDKNNAQNIINPLLSLRITVGFLVLCLYLSVLLVLDRPFTTKLIFAGSGCYLLTYAFYSDWALKGFEKFKYITFGELISGSIFLAATVSFVKHHEDVVIAPFIWSFSYIFGSISLLYVLSKKMGIVFTPSFDVGIWFSHVKDSIYFTMSGILRSVSQYLPILLLGIFFSSDDVGVFSATYKIVITLCHAGGLIAVSVFPILASLYKENTQTFLDTQKTLFYGMLFIGLMLGLGGTIFSDVIINLLLSNEYAQSSNVFKVMVWFLPISFARNVFGPTLQAANCQKYHMVSSSFSLIMMLVIGIFLIKAYGPMGGAIAMLLSESIVVVVMLCFFKKLVVLNA